MAATRRTEYQETTPPGTVEVTWFRFFLWLGIGYLILDASVVMELDKDRIRGAFKTIERQMNAQFDRMIAITPDQPRIPGE